MPSKCSTKQLQALAKGRAIRAHNLKTKTKYTKPKTSKRKKTTRVGMDDLMNGNVKAEPTQKVLYNGEWIEVPISQMPKKNSKWKRYAKNDAKLALAGAAGYGVYKGGKYAMDLANEYVMPWVKTILKPVNKIVDVGKDIYHSFDDIINNAVGKDDMMRIWNECGYLASPVMDEKDVQLLTSAENLIKNILDSGDRNSPLYQACANFTYYGGGLSPMNLRDIMSGMTNEVLQNSPSGGKDVLGRNPIKNANNTFVKSLKEFATALLLGDGDEAKKKSKEALGKIGDAKLQYFIYMYTPDRKESSAGVPYPDDYLIYHEANQL